MNQLGGPLKLISWNSEKSYEIIRTFFSHEKKKACLESKIFLLTITTRRNKPQNALILSGFHGESFVLE